MVNRPTKDNKGIQVTCHNQLCGYTWLYKGKSKFYAVCPRCLYRVNIQKQTLKEKIKKYDDNQYNNDSNIIEPRKFDIDKW